jgi:hypothetical protein
MPRFIATYDLERTTPDPHPTFLKKAPDFGWSRWIKGSDGKLNLLPNTTLQATFPTIEEALSAFKQVARATGREIGIPVKVEKFIIVSASKRIFKSDKSRLQTLEEILNG